MSIKRREPVDLTIRANSKDFTQKSYASIEDADEVAVFRNDFNPAWTAATDDAKSRYLFHATQWVDEHMFVGQKETDSDPLQWPRIDTGLDPDIDIIDVNGVPSAAIPADICKATAIVACTFAAHPTTIVRNNNQRRAIEISEVSATQGTLVKYWHPNIVAPEDNTTKTLNDIAPDAYALLRPFLGSTQDRPIPQLGTTVVRNNPIFDREEFESGYPWGFTTTSDGVNRT